MFVTRQFWFEAAHFLPNYHGKCENLHGHSYRMDVSIEGEIGECGMVLDFVILKDIVKRHLLSKLDHRHLNDFIKEPSAENIAVWCWNELFPHIPDGVKLHEIRVWETRQQYAAYRG